MEAKKCKHAVKLAFNNDEIVSYCDKCGKILDRYVKVQTAQYPYYNYMPLSAVEPQTISVGDPYKPEMGSTSDISDITSLK